MPHSDAVMPGAMRRAWGTALVLTFPLLSLVTNFAIGAACLLSFITALCWWRPSWQALRRHWPDVRWVVLAFLLHLVYFAALTLLRGGSDNGLDSPTRMCLAIGGMLVVLVARPPARALWLGAAFGALAALAFVGWQRVMLGIPRPGGLLYPITFGDLALVLAMLSLCGAVDSTGTTAAGTKAAGTRAGGAWRRAGIGIALLGGVCGLAASALTGSRGGWVALPVIFVFLLWRRDILPRRLAWGLPLLLGALVALAYAVPQTGVRERVAVGVEDVRLYLSGDPAATSLGVRFDLWKGALRVAREHPWTGLDTPDYKRQFHAWVDAGQLSPNVFTPPEPPHMHNDALQVLATRGWPGLLSWIGILLAPLAFFSARLRRTRSHGPQRAAALAGALLVLAYASFGLSEVIFWSMKGCVFYALLVFLLMGWCLVPADEHASV